MVNRYFSLIKHTKEDKDEKRTLASFSLTRRPLNRNNVNRIIGINIEKIKMGMNTIIKNIIDTAIPT